MLSPPDLCSLSSPLSQVREAQLNQYNFILVVGEQEASAGTVNVRTRDNEVKGVVPVTELIAQFAEMERSKI
jgi:threonyl-tRNA synthetase